ncbi:hypothetical protein GCM10027028_39340 [Streptomyces sundarbansensis]
MPPELGGRNGNELPLGCVNPWADTEVGAKVIGHPESGIYSSTHNFVTVGNNTLGWIEAHT